MSNKGYLFRWDIGVSSKIVIKHPYHDFPSFVGVTQPWRGQGELARRLDRRETEQPKSSSVIRRAATIPAPARPSNTARSATISRSVAQALRFRLPLLRCASPARTATAVSRFRPCRAPGSSSPGASTVTTPAPAAPPPARFRRRRYAWMMRRRAQAGHAR